MSEPHMTSALAHHQPIASSDDNAFAMTEVTDLGMIDLRGSPDDDAFLAACSSALNVALPSEPRTSARTGSTTVHWMSVDQWLIVLPAEAKNELFCELREATASLHCLVSDVSDARTIIRLEGDGARQALMKGTSVDMLAADVTPGWTRRLLFAEVAAACHMAAVSPERFDLFVFRSYADHVWRWLQSVNLSAAHVDVYGGQTPPDV